MKLRSVYLENFRSYKKINIKINEAKFIILTGKNGIGKTNLLEAISFLSPGKGLKNCNLNELINTNLNLKNCSLFFLIENNNKKNEVGIGFETKSIDDKFKTSKTIHLNKKKLKKQSDLTNLISLIWLTPEMDVFFRTNSLFRRKFIDRCIFNINTEYLDYLKIYEINLKERSKILKDISKKDFFYVEGKNVEKDLWLKKIEEKLVNTGIKIFQERSKFVSNFNSIPNNSNNFPEISISLLGDIEKILSVNSVDKAREMYLQKLHLCRKIDSIRGGISYGPNKSDLKVMFIKKKITAEKCSTGEQKIILLSMIIQFCKMMNNLRNSSILLLDEIVAHLDNKIKKSLFEELKTLKNQVWMSGSDVSLFSDIINDTETINLEIEDLLKQE